MKKCDLCNEKEGLNYLDDWFLCFECQLSNDWLGLLVFLMFEGIIKEPFDMFKYKQINKSHDLIK